MKKHNNTCLLITGTITPANGVYGLYLSDRAERRRQYIESIRFYIEKADVQHIVFCENSEAPEELELYKLARDEGKNFEWLSFRGNEQAVAERGKGYGEGEIIDYALNNSTVMKACTDFIKVTGRLRVININWVLRMTHEGSAYFYNCKEQYIDTRFYIISKAEYCNQLRDAYKSVNDREKYYLENVFLDRFKKFNIKYYNFPVDPHIEGICGSSGLVYHRSPVKVFGKSVLRMLKLIK